MRLGRAGRRRPRPTLAVQRDPPFLRVCHLPAERAACNTLREPCLGDKPPATASGWIALRCHPPTAKLNYMEARMLDQSDIEFVGAEITLWCPGEVVDAWQRIRAELEELRMQSPPQAGRRRGEPDSGTATVAAPTAPVPSCPPPAGSTQPPLNETARPEGKCPLECSGCWKVPCTGCGCSTPA
jgi:hypothetical protein